MKDASDSIRDWIYGVLYGTVWYNGASVAVYSFPPKDQSFPYILIAEQSMNGEQGTKDSYVNEHSATIEIWTSSTENDASYVMANSISNDVLQILRQRTQETSGSGGSTVGTISGFNTISITVENLVTNRFLMDKNINIYKSITLRILLEEQ